ncbi:MAG: aminotransferase class I/II-fold pyridoxal phosphate-dependent enzyme [Caldilineaceae bacterium]
MFIASSNAVESTGADVILLTIGDLPDFLTHHGHCEYNGPQSSERPYSLYAPSRHRPLRTAIADYHSRQTGQLVSAENVAVVQGAQCALYVAAMCTLQPGDEVIMSDPVYSTYPAVIGATGATPCYVPLHAERNFHLDLQEVAGAITPRTRAMLFNTPHNPTGAVMTRDEVAGLAQLALQHDLWLITDEVYANFTYTHPHTSPASMPALADRAITVSSLSKSHAMTGWRLGWVIGPAEMIEYASRLLMVMSYGGPPFIQDGAVTALTAEISEVAEMRHAYRKRAEVVAEILSDTPGIGCCETEGGMYALLDVRHSGLSSMDFAARACAEAHVAMLPGDAFGPNLQGYLRLSLVVPEERLIEACQRVRRFATEKFG